jgi:uncharacterized protein with LGFP repeats
MKHLVFIALTLSAFSTAAMAQQRQDGKGQTCTAVNERCYTLGGSAGICEPKFKQCLQTGTYPGNNFTITNLQKR